MLTGTRRQVEGAPPTDPAITAPDGRTCALRVAHAHRPARHRRRRPRCRTPFGPPPPPPRRPVRSESASLPDLLRYTLTRAHTTFFSFSSFFFSSFSFLFLVFCLPWRPKHRTPVLFTRAPYFFFYSNNIQYSYVRNSIRRLLLLLYAKRKHARTRTHVIVSCENKSVKNYSSTRVHIAAADQIPRANRTCYRP